MGWLKERVERVNLAAVTGAVGAAVNHLPMGPVLLRGFEWVYDRALAGAPGLDGAAELAECYRARHGSEEAAIDALILWQSGAASVAGFVTGIGGAITLPIALPAHVASALYIQVRLIAAIAYLRGHDLESEEVKAVVLACVAGSAAANKLKDVGAGFIGPLARQTAQRLPGEAMKNLGGAVGGHVAKRVGGSHAARLLPVLGGVISGGFDAAATRLIGHAAKKAFASRLPAAETIAAGSPAASG